MPRPHRIHLEEVTYHVFTRCIDRRELIHNDHYKDTMLETIERTQCKYDFDLVFYQIMDNHIHLVIKTHKNGPTISRIMQYLKARFAEMYNRKNSRTGPFWNERFGDVIVELQDNPLFYFFWLLWYLAYNAVRKAKVVDPRQYRYGSINHYLNVQFTGRLNVKLHKFYIEASEHIVDRLKIFIAFEGIYRKRHWMPL